VSSLSVCQGGSLLELMLYDERGNVNTTYNLTDGYVGADNITCVRAVSAADPDSG